MTAIYPHSFIADLSGRPIDNGRIWIGEANQDPEVFPIPVYWDADLTIPAAQPIELAAGYIVNAGARADVYVAVSEYSLRLRDKHGVEVDYIPAAIDALGSLSAPTGADLVGFIQDAPNATPRTVLSKLREDQNSVNDFMPDDFPLDGSSDARSYFATADTAGPFMVPPGRYLIGSNITISNLMTVQPGVRLVIPDGVTVTFNGGIEAAPLGQIFEFSGSGTGAIAGLLDLWVTWFCGDTWNNPSRVDGRALAQKAYDACGTTAAGGSIVRWPSGYMKHDGAAITVTKGQKSVGGGFRKTILLWSTTKTSGFLISGNAGALIEGIGCSWADYRLLPTEGTFIFADGGFLCTFRDIYCGVSYSAIIIANEAAACTLDNVQLYESFNLGIHITGSGDIYTDKFLISSLTTYLTLTDITGTFQIGESFVGYADTAKITQIDDNIYRVNGSGLFSGTVTGAISGATATVASCQIPHAQGAIRLTDHVEAAIFANGDVLGGQYSMVTFATTNSSGLRPAYNKFTNVYFDSSMLGTNCNQSIEFDFTSCWWSGPGPQGGLFESCDGFKFVGGGAINCGGYGHVVNATCTNFIYSGFSARGNGRATADTYSGLLFKANTGQFVVTGCIGVDDNLGFGTQKYAVEIEAGASDRYQVFGNRFPASKLFDGGTGTNKNVGNNF